MHTYRSVGLALIALAVTAFLTACGGGDDGTSSGLTIWDAKPLPTYAYPIQMFTNEAPEGVVRHFAAGEFQGFGSVHYNTDPPTSGRHVGDFAQNFLNEVAVPDEIAVHMMEHGYVDIWYNCNAAPALTATACASLKNSLTQVTNEAYSSGKLAMLTPDTTMTHHIALTAWQFMDTFDDFDALRVRTFIDTLNCRYDPEKTCT